MLQHWSIEFLTREGFVISRPFAHAPFLDFDPVFPDGGEVRSVRHGEGEPEVLDGDRDRRPGE